MSSVIGYLGQAPRTLFLFVDFAGRTWTRAASKYVEGSFIYVAAAQ